MFERYTAADWLRAGPGQFDVTSWKSCSCSSNGLAARSNELRGGSHVALAQGSDEPDSPQGFTAGFAAGVTA
jgi:hypothetical protein